MKTHHFTPSGDLRYGPRKTDQPRSERSDMVGVMTWMLVAVVVWSVLAVRAVWV